MGDNKTPTEIADKEMNKLLGKAIADRKYKIKQLEAQIKKLEKEIEKIKNGELVPDREDDSSHSPSIIKSSITSNEPLINPYRSPYTPSEGPYKKYWLHNGTNITKTFK